jgi:response regulator RpfG family c-di-GMP phosphodiesterase
MKDKSVILIVDDQIQNIELLEAHLASQSYGIIKATGGEEALRKLSGNQIDLILLDVMMPGMDGFEVTRRIKLDKIHRLIPIILITALRDMEDRIKGIEAGCDDFISKPIDKLELLARVQSLLKVKAYNDLLGNYRKELKSEVARKTGVIQKTLQGSIKMLVDILALINPDAYDTAQISRKLIRSLCKRLRIDVGWEYEIAVMLSSIGLSTLPPDIIDKYRRNQAFNNKEQLVFKSHPAIAQQLISNIPGLESVAEAVGCQMTGFSKTSKIQNKHVASIARMLKLTLDFTIAEKRRVGNKMDILASFKEEADTYDPEMLAALEAELRSVETDFIIREVSPRNIVPGMVLFDNIFDEKNTLIVHKGIELTEILKMRLLNFLKLGRKISKIKILVHVDSKKPDLS